jgi:DNA-binding beta-propeller fold protein YncE
VIGGSVWVADYGSGQVSTVRAAISASGADFDGIAISGGAVWAGDFNNGLVDRISPASNSIAARVNVGGGPRYVLAVGGDLWVALFDDGAVVRLRPSAAR